MFSYLGVLISVILGLALTHLLIGMSKLIQMRRLVRPYWVQLIWTVNVTIYVLVIWWGMFWWNKLQVWTIEEFFFLTAYAIVLFVLASMLYPWEFYDGLDMEEFFFANRTWFFGILLVATLLDIPETLGKQVGHLRATPTWYALYIPMVLVILIVGFRSQSRRVHKVLCLAWFVATTGYVGLTAISRIGT